LSLRLSSLQAIDLFMCPVETRPIINILHYFSCTVPHGPALVKTYTYTPQRTKLRSGKWRQLLCIQYSAGDQLLCQSTNYDCSVDHGLSHQWNGVYHKVHIFPNCWPKALKSPEDYVGLIVLRCFFPPLYARIPQRKIATIVQEDTLFGTLIAPISVYLPLFTP